MPHVEILYGSPSDEPFIEDSLLIPRLKEAGFTVHTASISAHRNPEELRDYIARSLNSTNAYICCAGWAAALPGAVKALLLGKSLATVFGIALPSAEYPDGLDAEISIKRLPPGIDVVYGGVGTEALDAIADQVLQAAAEYDPFNPDWNKLDAVIAKVKPPRYDTQLKGSLHKGKTKRIKPTENLFEADVVSKDDITAEDGLKRDLMEGKAAASTRTTCNIFEMLERNGVRTHFVKRVDDVTFRARRVDMIPLELIARRIATGSYLDRHPEVADGTVFGELVFEVFEKDDANHDPLLEFDFEAGILRRYVPNKKAAKAIGPDVKAGDLLREEPLSQSRYASVTPDLVLQLRDVTLGVFWIIEQAWKQVGGTYFDYKIECGFDLETGELLVADVIDSDSGRLRFGDKDMSKQAYRDGSQSLPDIKKNFDEVAALTDNFV